MAETTALSREQILQNVRQVLEEALGADEEDITPEATLTGDLEAESIDFLDIVFRLEKKFSTPTKPFKISQGELFPENLAGADTEFVQEGMVTEKGIAELRARMPHADVDAFAEDPKVENIQELFTVDMICKFLESKLK